MVEILGAIEILWFSLKKNGLNVWTAAYRVSFFFPLRLGHYLKILFVLNIYPMKLRPQKHEYCLGE